MEDKIICCLIFVFVCCSVVTYSFGYLVGRIDVTNYYKENINNNKR